MKSNELMNKVYTWVEGNLIGTHTTYFLSKYLRNYEYVQGIYVAFFEVSSSIISNLIPIMQPYLKTISFMSHFLFNAMIDE